MPGLRVTRFGGIRPATNARLLDPRMATVAHNTLLRDGTVQQLQGGAAVHDGGITVGAFVRLPFTPDGGGGIFAVPYRAAIIDAPLPGSRDYGTYVVFPYDDPTRRPQRYLSREQRFAPLEVPAPTAALSFSDIVDQPVTAAVGPDERMYTYTWVDEFGVESRPAPASVPLRLCDGAALTISGFSPPPPNAIAMRLYRASSAFDDGRRPSNSFDSSFQLVQELPPDIVTYRDTARLIDTEGGTLLTQEDQPVPATFSQVVLTEAGYYVGWQGNTLYVSERNEPHVWPLRYQLELADLIVGVATSGVHVFVGTTGRPYRVSITPAERATSQAAGNMPMADAIVDAQQYPFDWPCVSVYAMVGTDFGAVYPSPQGLVALRAQGGVLLETKDRIDETQWAQWVPNTAAWWRGRYYACNAPAGRGWIVDLTADGDSLEMGDFTTADLDFTLAHNGRDGQLYFAKGGRITQWGRGTTLTYRWRSKTFVVSGEMGFAGAKVVGAYGPPVTFRLFKRGTLVLTRSVVASRPFRLPMRGRDTEWSFEIEGTTPVTEVHVASSFAELTLQENQF